MKKNIILLILSLNVCLANSYKDRLNDGIEIIIKHLSEKKISFEFKQDNETLLSGTAVDKYSYLALESNYDEEQRLYFAIEYWNTAEDCLLSFRIQCEPAADDDTKTRLRIKSSDDPKCEKYNELEDVIFFKQ